MDVYTTINVQHIESLKDMVAAITGVIVRERVPDKIFDDADEVRLVDIEPQELLERLRAGKIYGSHQVKQATNHFFTLENLTALREIALRRCADRINRLCEEVREKNGSAFYTDEHILVCLSSSPTNQKIIRNGARMAKAFKGTFTALFIETPDFPTMSQENKNRLRENIHLAEQLGATVELSYGEDVALQISEFARLSGVSKIVVGRSAMGKKNPFKKPPLTDQLIEYAPNVDIYVIPDRETVTYEARRSSREKNPPLLPRDIVISLGILAGTTLLGYAFDHLGFSEANIITIYILGVLITAVITTRRAYSLVSSVLSVLIFNFCFTEPRFTLNFYDAGYMATFAITFIAAFITGNLADKIKQQAKQSAATAYRTKILLDTNQMLSQARDREKIVQTLAKQLSKLLHRDLIFYLDDGGSLSDPITYAWGDGAVDEGCLSENEKAVAAWVFKNNKHAGATTTTLAEAKSLYLALRVREKVYGVVGIVMGENALDSFENSILLSILGEGALAMESNQAILEKERAAVLAKNEQLRANLLRSISHDLRTPLTAISGNAGLLMASEAAMNATTRKELYTNIYDDSLWLINLVENLLAVTKIEDGSMHLKLTAELLDEIIDESLHHVNREKSAHHLVVHHSEDFLLVKMDARLMMQVIINIVDNAIKYTQKGSTITIASEGREKWAVLTISDDGPGIPPEAQPHIFEMFYTAEAVTDSRRSLGLGLALCQSIVAAHGGTITVADARGGGTVFTITLPLEEVTIHE